MKLEDLLDNEKYLEKKIISLKMKL